MNMSLFGGETGTARVLQTVVGALRANFSFDLRDSALASHPMALAFVVRADGADGPDGGPPLASATAFLDVGEQLSQAAASPPAVWGCAATAVPSSNSVMRIFSSGVVARPSSGSIPALQGT